MSPFWLRQHIDEMLAGALTQEDEDAVLAELDAITQVGVGLNALLLPFSWWGRWLKASAAAQREVQGRGTHPEGRMYEG